ncbi:MAG TPA: hypothetical protein VNF02_04380 [Candidatus Limnocylindrales bacterium]|nr:hypothetical protein [Candidatus Limnocylindrales bacterium]
MAKKKPKRLKKAVRAKALARKKKPAIRRRVTAKKKTSRIAASKRAAQAARKAARKNKATRRERLSRGVRSSGNDIAMRSKGPGSASAGQSGDLQGLSNVESADSESVDELLEDGQAYEAGIVDGVENAPDPDQGEVTTREVPQDDPFPRKRNTL